MRKKCVSLVIIIRSFKSELLVYASPYKGFRGHPRLPWRQTLRARRGGGIKDEPQNLSIWDI